MDWHHSESGSRPSESEHISGNRVFLRKNIVSYEREGVTMYGYDECLLTEAQYAEYINAKATSKIDYVAMMKDVELPVEAM